MNYLKQFGHSIKKQDFTLSLTFDRIARVVKIGATSDSSTLIVARDSRWKTYEFNIASLPTEAQMEWSLAKNL